MLRFKPGHKTSFTDLSLSLPVEVLAELPVAAADGSVEWLLAVVVLILLAQRRRD